MAPAWRAGSGAGSALAPGGLHEAVGLAPPAGGIGARLLLGFGQQPRAGLLNFGAHAGELVLARAPGVVELDVRRLASAGDDRLGLTACGLLGLPRAPLGGDEQLARGGLGPRRVEQRFPLALSPRPDLRRLDFGVTQRLRARPCVRIGPAPRPLERRLRLHARALEQVRRFGLAPGQRAFAFLQRGPLVTEGLARRRAHEPPADLLQVTVDLLRVITAPDQRNRALDHEQRQRLPA